MVGGVRHVGNHLLTVLTTSLETSEEETPHQASQTQADLRQEDKSPSPLVS